eukprot:280117-Pleurochrysis_carterae.AAC.3
MRRIRQLSSVVTRRHGRHIPRRLVRSPQVRRHSGALAKVRKVFEELDADASGFLSTTELRPALMKLGTTFDSSGDGELSLSEFHRSYLMLQNQRWQEQLATQAKCECVSQ